MVGHIDHGKSSILDKIRNTAIVASEAGGITQAIGASIIPISTIKKISGNLLEKHKLEIKIPGFIILDTPGHAAFTNLRKRGGNLADIAVLVIDINEGIKPQTLECIDILKQYKTPFVVALNKIDLLPGWRSNPNIHLLENIQKQNESTMLLLEKKLYEIVGRLSEFGFNAERFDRVEDYTKQIAIIPLSAKTSDGLSELLMVMTGLSQRFLEQNLIVNVKGNAKGTVLEVKEEKGLGTSLDVIIYDGSLKQNDTIVIGALVEPIVTKVKALFEPAALAEMRDKKSKFKSVKQVTAATGVKISAPELDNVIAGMPLRSCLPSEVEKVKQEIKKEVSEVVIETDKQGIVIKADSLGSLEALLKILKEKNIEIKKASIGNISKKDISDAEISHEKDPLESAVLGFNVSLMPDVKVPQNVKVISNKIIYKLIDEFEKWQESERKRIEGKETEYLHRPCKIQVLKGYIFRQSNPAVVGIDVLAGTLKAGTPLMKNDGESITQAKSIQKEQETIEKAEKGKQVAVSLPNVTVGRQISEGDILYSAIPEGHFRKFKEFKKNISQEEIALLKEIAEIMRQQNPMWGI
jgi:translation initiation factor 5B|tara:strand:- start:1429 stop:3168 length:1740 start_codon:yes stop_codon:yes gene_type:complete